MPGLPPLTRLCDDCGVKHLVQDCLMNQEVNAKAPTNLNIIKVWPSTISPSSSEIDVVILIQVVTRAQARELKEENEDGKKETTPSESTRKSIESCKARRIRRVTSKKKQNREINKGNKIAIGESVQEEHPQKETEKESRERQLAGLVLAEKYFEPLDALLQVYEA